MSRRRKVPAKRLTAPTPASTPAMWRWQPRTWGWAGLIMVVALVTGAFAWVGTDDRAGSATAAADSPAPVRQDPPRKPIVDSAAIKSAIDKGKAAALVDPNKRRTVPVDQNKRPVESVEQDKRRTESVQKNKRWVLSRLTVGRSSGSDCKAVGDGRITPAICRVTEPSTGKNYHPRPKAKPVTVRVKDVGSWHHCTERRAGADCRTGDHRRFRPARVDWDKVPSVRPPHLKERSLKASTPHHRYLDRARPAYPRSDWQPRSGGPGAHPHLDGPRSVRVSGAGIGNGAFGG